MTLRIRRVDMKLKLNTEGGSVIIDSSMVTNFSPCTDNGGNDTRIEFLLDSGERDTVIVKHDFYQVTAALSQLWELDKKRSEADHDN